MKRILFFLAATFSMTYAFGQSRTVGTLMIDTNQVYEGYTLFSPIHNNPLKTYLINNCGDTVHTWQATLGAGLHPTLLANGNLLRPAIEPTATVVAGGSGGRIQIFTWDNDLVWDYTYSNATHNQHHEVVAMPNGNFLILSWDVKDSAACVAKGRNPATIPDDIIWTEKIVEVQPTGLTTGNIVWEWDIWDHLIQDFDSTKQNYGVIADHPELLDINHLGWSGGGKDWLHANAINYNPLLDQIVMSCRYSHEIYVIDHSTTLAESATHSGGNRGKGGDILFRWGNPQVYGQGGAADQTLWAQHNCEWIVPGLVDAGKIMIFNNGNTRPGGDHSSIDVINPKVDSAGNYLLFNGKFEVDSGYWSYKAPVPTDFFSAFISNAQRLPNGNTLICSGTWGEFFEINPAKEIVWKYRSPVTTTGVLSQGSTPPSNTLHGTVNWVFRAYKYDPAHPALAGKTLTPGAPVELNPLPSLCSEAVAVEENNDNNFSVYPNPSAGLITLEGLKAQTVTILNSFGAAVITQQVSDQNESIDLSGLADGLYMIKTEGRTLKIVLKK